MRVVRRIPGTVHGEEPMPAAFSGVAWRGARRVALIGLRRPDEHPWTIDAAFDAIETWLRVTGQSVVYRVWQRRRAPDPATYIGRGKAVQLRELCERAGVDGVLINGTLSRSQRDGLRRLLDRPVWDRTVWGVTQKPPVPVSRARESARAARRRNGTFTVVLCGAAGAGKSTLFAALTHGAVSPPSSWPVGTRASGPGVVSRRLRVASWTGDVVVTDTPGLIRNPDSAAWTVPDETLDECRGADLVVHVIDASHPEANRWSREVAAALDHAGIHPVLSVRTQADRIATGSDGIAPRLASGRTGWGCEALRTLFQRMAAHRASRVVRPRGFML